MLHFHHSRVAEVWVLRTFGLVSIWESKSVFVLEIDVVGITVKNIDFMEW